jgi:4-amino-4-deoxy-L-arabinose transferase-like glycosyltransferase
MPFNEDPAKPDQAGPGSGVLVLLASALLLLHCLTNGQYGFHRDELPMLDDSRHLAWGYVGYPPLTPWLGRLGLELFGPSLVGVRFFSALAQSCVVVLAGLMARALGGSRKAEVVTAIAVAIAPVSLIQGALFQYVSFDYLWWVSIAYFTLRLLKSDDPRWWLGIGAVVGLGMMTRYTIIFPVAGLAVGVVATKERRQLKSPWLWGGVAIALVVWLPNLLWQLQHDFVSLDHLRAIHTRDVRMGRTTGFLIEQLKVPANPVTIPFWATGLAFYFLMPAGRPYRLLGWMYLVPLLLFVVVQGRSYYLAPAYPMLIAAGVVTWEHWLSSRRPRTSRLFWALTWGALTLGGVMLASVMLPVAPVNSSLWRLSSRVHDNFVEEIGWQELAETVARVYAALPEEEKRGVRVLAGNYGEAGAIDMYARAYELPQVISGINSYRLRGFGDPPPQTVIVLGFARQDLERIFMSCDRAGTVANRYGVENEETRSHSEIYVCREPRRPWPEVWKELPRFG